MSKTTSLMTKLDKQFVAAKSGSKMNGFFKEFFENNCYPHLVITPTLAVDNMSIDELFPARQKLLDQADDYERDQFRKWKKELKISRDQNEGDQDLTPEIVKLIGFDTARDVMRSIMLKDMVERLPEVLITL